MVFRHYLLSPQPNMSKSSNQTEEKIINIYSHQVFSYTTIIGLGNRDDLIRKCVDEEESRQILKEFHSGICGGHFSDKNTSEELGFL